MPPPEPARRCGLGVSANWPSSVIEPVWNTRLTNPRARVILLRHLPPAGFLLLDFQSIGSPWHPQAGTVPPASAIADAELTRPASTTVSISRARASQPSGRSRISPQSWTSTGAEPRSSSGGDLNVSPQIRWPDTDAHEAVIKRIKAFGFRDCLRDTHTGFVGTYRSRNARSRSPWQGDWVFASDRLRPRAHGGPASYAGP